MAKDSINNGNNINGADRVENAYLPSGQIPASYPTAAGNVGIDGDSSTYTTYQPYQVDLKEIHAVSSLVFRTGGFVRSYTVEISTTDTDDKDSVSYNEDITSYCSYDSSTGIITCTPTTRFVCRWYRLTISAQTSA